LTQKGNVFDLEVGTCLTMAEFAEGETFTDVPTKECTEAHDAEVIWRGDATTADYDQLAFQTQAEEDCPAAMESYVGPNWGDTNLGYSYIYPDQKAWDSGERALTCYAATLDNQPTLTASVKDTAL
jgi:hypothetical protein